tara:strand:- start:54 stop:3806 length:3753 start_codon:yes stop_codon:yes gene_type:complete
MAQQKDNYYYGDTGTQGLKWYEQVGVGLGSGALKIGEGILELGAGVSDYAFDTDLLEYLEENYPKINVDDGLGKLVETVVQFGVPYGAALKIASKVSKVKKLGEVAKAGGIKGTAAKLGYYALPAVVSEPFAATNRDATLGQAFGLYSEGFVKKLNPEQYEGREKAAAHLQQKLLFGLEAGPVVGGVTTFLGPAIKGTAKAVGFVGAPVVKGAETLVMNPLAKVVTSERTGIPQVLRGMERTRIKTGEKLGIPKYQEWGLRNTKSISTKERIFKRLDNVLATMRTRGRADIEVQPALAKAFNTVEAAKKGVDVHLTNIDRLANNLAKASGKVAKDETTVFKNEIFENIGNFLVGKKVGKNRSALSKLGSSEIKNAARGLKKEFDALKNSIKNLGLSEGEINTLFRGDIDRYLNRSFELVRNSKYKVRDADREAVSKLFVDMLRKDKVYKNFKKGDPADDAIIKQVADDHVDELVEIGTRETSITKMIKEASEYIAADVGVVPRKFLKGKEELPDVVRKLMGESVDKRTQILDTVADMATVIGKTQSLDDLAKALTPKGMLIEAGSLAEAKAIFRANTNIGKIRDLKLVKIEKTADMNKTMARAFIGKYTTPEIAAALKGQALATDILLQSSIYKAFLATKGVSQLSKTVLSPTTQIRNVESAAMFAMANGHFGRGASLRDAFKLVFDDVIGPKGAIDVERLAAKGEEFRRYGLTNSNIITREVQALVDDIVRTTKETGKLGRTENILKRLQDNSVLANATKVYQGGDDVWKIFGYEFEKSKLLNIIKGDGQHLDDAQRYYQEVFGRRFENYMPDGVSLKTREEAIREIAAETIKNTYPNYSYVPTLVQNLRRLPLGNFISFPAEMYRTSFNLIKFGLREMQSSDQFVRQSGAKKLIGFSSAIAAGKVAQESAMTLVGVKEEELNALRESFVAPWHRSGPLIPVSVERGEKTKYKFINFAYQSPYDVLSAPYYAAMGQINKARLEEKELNDVMFKAFFGDESGPGAFTSLLSPFISESIITERIADITFRGGRTKTGRKIYSDEEDASDQMVKGVFHLLEGLTPGALTQVTNMAKGIVGERGKYKEEYNASDEALALLAGIRVTETDIGKAVGFNVNSFLKDQQEAKRLLTSQFGLENVNPQTIYREYERLLLNKYENYSEIRKVFEDAIKLGHDKKYILQKHSRRFTKKDLNVILSGRFIADDFGALLKDVRLQTVLRNRGVKLRDFIDFDRLKEIRDKYNRLRFADRLR